MYFIKFRKFFWLLFLQILFLPLSLISCCESYYVHVGTILVSHRSLRFSSFPSIFFSCYSSNSIISTVLSSGSLIRSSVSSNLLLNHSGNFFFFFSFWLVLFQLENFYLVSCNSFYVFIDSPYLFIHLFFFLWFPLVFGVYLRQFFKVFI